MNVKAIVLHHTGTGIGSVGDGSDVAKSIADTVQRVYGGKYKSSYHILVGPTGRIFEGQTMGTVAPHCGIDEGDYYQDSSGVNNQNSIAVSAIGNFQVNMMPEAQIKALGDTLRRLRSTYTYKPFFKLHRELVNTSCPGINYPYAKIYKLAEEEPLKKVKMTVRVQGENKFTVEMSDGKKVPIGSGGNHPIVINESIWLPLRTLQQAMRPGAVIYWDAVNKIATVEWEE